MGEQLKKLYVLLLIIIILISGCSFKKNEVEKLRDLEFTVLKEEEIPDEMKVMIEENKEQESKLTYSDEGYLYICAGYGKQNTGGYSIQVNKLYLNENAIHIDTSLIGPKSDENVSQTPSYPYLVVKTEFIDKNVVFE